MPKIAALFEAEDDLHLVGQIALSLGLPKLTEKPWNLDGYDQPKLESKLTQAARADYDRIVLVLDADHPDEGGPAKRWKAVREALHAAKIGVPDDVTTKDGLVHDLADGRRVAVWLFPDCRGEGAMEDFVLQRLVPEHDPLLGHATGVVDGLPDRRFAGKHTRKAQMRTWLAWQKRPGVPPGRAITERVLPVDEARLGTFAAWLRCALG